MRIQVNPCRKSSSYEMDVDQHAERVLQREKCVGLPGGGNWQGSRVALPSTATRLTAHVAR